MLASSPQSQSTSRWGKVTSPLKNFNKCQSPRRWNLNFVAEYMMLIQSPKFLIFCQFSPSTSRPWVPFSTWPTVKLNHTLCISHSNLLTSSYSPVPWDTSYFFLWRYGTEQVRTSYKGNNSEKLKMFTVSVVPIHNKNKIISLSPIGGEVYIYSIWISTLFY